MDRTLYVQTRVMAFLENRSFFPGILAFPVLILSCMLVVSITKVQVLPFVAGDIEQFHFFVSFPTVDGDSVDRGPFRASVLRRKLKRTVCTPSDVDL